MNQSQTNRRLLQQRGPVLVAGGIFFYWLSLYLYVPILPLHAQDLGASLSMVGAVIAAYSIAQVVLRLPLGIAADTFARRKPFAIASMAVAALGALLLASAPGPSHLFGARAVTGIAAAGWVPISVLYTSYFPTSNATRSIGIIMAVNASGLVIGTFSGGLLAEAFGVQSTFYVSAAAAVMGGLLLLFAPELKSIAQVDRITPRSIIEVIKSPLLIQISAIGITTQFTTFAINFGFLPVYAESIGASKAHVGYITTTLLTAGVGGALAATFLTDRVGFTRSLLIASATTLMAFVATPWIGTLLPLGAVQILSGFGRGAINTVLFALAVHSAPASHRATAMGTYQAIYAIGMLSGPAVSGALSDSVGINAVFYLAAGVTTVGAILVVIRALPNRLT